jgi:hypothetical protein
MFDVRIHPRIHPDLGPLAGMWRAVKNPFNHDLAPCSLADSPWRWQGLVFQEVTDGALTAATVVVARMGR